MYLNHLPEMTQSLKQIAQSADGFNMQMDSLKRTVTVCQNGYGYGGYGGERGAQGVWSPPPEHPKPCELHHSLLHSPSPHPKNGRMRAHKRGGPAIKMATQPRILNLNNRT